MSLYLDRIKQLVELQAVDDALYAVDKALEQAPKKVEALDAEFQTVDAQRSKLKDKLAHMFEQMKRIDNEVEDDTSRLRKSKSKLMQVANSKEYQAMSREMDSMEKVSRTREEERSALSDEIRIQTAALEQTETQWQAVKEKLDAEQAGLDASIEEARARRVDLEKQRSMCGSDVPRPILDRYEFIQRRLPHPVIVPVTNAVCDGCRISIPPQTYIELQSGNKILNCPNCRRLIYWSEHFSVDGSRPGAADDE